VRMIRERPRDKDREIAARVGVSHKTVWTYRKELEEALEKFMEAWRGLDAVQRREFVAQYRAELSQASAV
jgi:BMFP domain-containing protein YqiC